MIYLNVGFFLLIRVHVFLVFLGYSHLAASKSCYLDWFYDTEQCYQIKSDHKNWTGAKESCKSMGAFLSFKESELLNEMAAGAFNQVWISDTMNSTNGTNNKNDGMLTPNSTCISLYSNGSKAEVSCHNQLPYVCQMSAFNCTEFELPHSKKCIFQSDEDHFRLDEGNKTCKKNNMSLFMGQISELKNISRRNSWIGLIYENKTYKWINGEPATNVSFKNENPNITSCGLYTRDISTGAPVVVMKMCGCRFSFLCVKTLPGLIMNQVSLPPLGNCQNDGQRSITRTPTITHRSVLTPTTTHMSVLTPTATHRCIPCNCPSMSSSKPPETSKNSQNYLKKRLEQLENHLKVNKKSLSSYVRHKSSAKDDRPSAKSIGWTAVIIMAAPVVLITMMDFPVLTNHFKMAKKNLMKKRQGF